MTARLKAELELAWNATSEAEALAEARAHALAAAEKRIHILEGGLAEARDDRETLEATARDVLQLKRALEDERRQQTVFARRAGEAAAHSDAELRAAAERVAAARDDAAAWRATSEALRERFDKARKAARTYKRELHAARGLGSPQSVGTNGFDNNGHDVAALEASLVETRRHRDESLADAAREKEALRLELQRQKEEVIEARRRVREAERARDAGADASGGLVSRLDDAERTVKDLQQKLNAARNDNDALRSQKESNEDLQRERERDTTLLRSRADTAEQRCRDLDSRLRTVADERDRQRQRADEFEADLAGRGSRDGEVNALKRELESARRDAQRRRDDDAARSTQLTKLETDRLEAKCKALESDVDAHKKRADAAQSEIERLATRPRPSLSRDMQTLKLEDDLETARRDAIQAQEMLRSEKERSSDLEQRLRQAERALHRATDAALERSGQAYDRVASQEELRDLRDEVKRRRSSGVVGEAEEVQALRQDLDDLRQQNRVALTDAAAREEALAATIKENELSKKESEVEIDRLRSDVEALRQQARSLRDASAARAADKERHINETVEREQRLKQLEGEIGRLRVAAADRAALEVEVQRLRGEHASLLKERSSKESESNDRALSAELAAKELEVEVDRLRAAAASVEDLEARTEHLQRELAQRKATERDLSREVKRLRDENRGIDRDESARLRREATERIQAERDLARKNDDLEQEALRLRRAVDDARDAEREARAEADDLRRGTSDDSRILKEAREKARKAQDLTHELSAERDSLVAKLANATAEASREARRRDDRERQLVSELDQGGGLREEVERLRASEARLRRELDAAPSSDDSNGPTKRRLSQLERELQSSQDELKRLRAMEFGSGEVAALKKRLEEETQRADQADADAVTLADQLAQAGGDADLRDRLRIAEDRADAAERRAQDLTARERKLDALRASVNSRRGEVDADTVEKLATRERELAAANHEIEDLKDALCEAKMAVATSAAEIEDLRMSARQQRVSTADLARSASPTQAPAEAPPKPKGSWFSSSKKSHPMK